MLVSRRFRFWTLFGFAISAWLDLYSVPPLVAAPLDVSPDASFALADGSIELFNVRINPDGSVGEVDFGSSSAPVTVLFNGFLGKIAFAVYARLSGATLPGVSGAEFYLEGLEANELPPGWTKTVIPAPGSSVVGEWSDPTGDVRRVRVSWSVDGPADADCQKDALVYLGRVELQSPFMNPNLGGKRVRVIAGDPPSDPRFACPVVYLCDFPFYTGFCVREEEFQIGLPRIPELANPFPADGAVSVQPDVVLAWEAIGDYFCEGLGTPYTSVDFGTSADPPRVFMNYDAQQFSFDPPDILAPNTTYYWRIHTTPDHDCGFATSPVWSFTTVEPLGAETTTWATVKGLFR